MSDELPLVTVLIPARNEEADIERCLRAVLAQDYPHDRMEIVLVDGNSTDGTRAVVDRTLSETDVNWTVIENPRGTTPSNLNAGLGVAIGDVVCRVDARSIVPRGYVRRCSEILRSRPDVVVTGGAQRSIARRPAVKSVGIARALNNRYAMGGSRYRSGAPSGPSDTVYLGSFRIGQLRAAGGWDEYFETNQDYELSRRMGRLGVIWFDARLVVEYLPRQSLSGLWRQYYRFGRWKVRYWRRTGDPPRRRQILPLVLVPSLVLGLLGVSIRAEQRERAALGAGALFAAMLGALCIDAVGSDRDASPVVRLTSGAASTVVVFAWTAGVVREAVSVVLVGVKP